MSLSYGFLVVAALLIGLLVPGAVIWLAPYTVWLLAAIFFISALHLDFQRMWWVAADLKMIMLSNVLMLLVFPLLVYVLARFFVPDMALSLLLLAAMPAGMTTPLLVRVLGGNEALGLVLTVTTSLLAPLTVPTVIRTLVGVNVVVSYWDMFWSLLVVIVAPFGLAQLVRLTLPARVWRPRGWSMFVSIGLLLFLIASIVSERSDLIWNSFVSGEAWRYLVVLMVFFVGFHVVGYGLSFRRERQDRLTIVVGLAYMNFTLAIVLAQNFFEQSEVVVPVVLAVIPWSLLLPVLRVVLSFKGRD